MIIPNPGETQKKIILHEVKIHQSILTANGDYHKYKGIMAPNAERGSTVELQCLDTFAVLEALSRLDHTERTTVLTEFSFLKDSTRILESGKDELLPQNDLEKFFTGVVSKWEDQGRMKFPVSPAMAKFIINVTTILLNENPQYAQEIGINQDLMKILPADSAAYETFIEDGQPPNPRFRITGTSGPIQQGSGRFRMGPTIPGR